MRACIKAISLLLSVVGWCYYPVLGQQPAKVASPAPAKTATPKAKPAATATKPVPKPAPKLADITDYKPMANQVKIPVEVITPSTEKYEKIIQEKLGGSKARRKAMGEFYLQSSFTIDELLQSGKVLFNDTINTYFREIAATLMKKEPTALANMQFFVLRSPAVNAFAAPNGMIFVNMGLLAQVEDEAQLALVLSHEITHVTNAHSINIFLSAKGISTESSADDLLKTSSIDNKLTDMHNYSKGLELEADIFGLERVLKSPYEVKTLSRLFDILKYSYLPFDEVAFRKGVLETTHIELPDEYFLSSVKKIADVNEEEDDPRSTHPSIARRKSTLEEAIKEASGTRSLYVVSEERFKQIQYIAQMELPQLYLHRQMYQEAIYYAYLSLVKQPKNRYLQEIIGKALYRYARFRANGEINIPAENADFTEIEGEMQQVYHVLGKIPEKELTVLAAAYIWELMKNAPQKTEYRWMMSDLAVSLINDFDLPLSAFKTESKEVVQRRIALAKADSINAAQQKLAAEKAAKVKGKVKPNASKAKETPPPPPPPKVVEKQEDYYLYAFSDEMNSPEMIRIFEEAAVKCAELKKRKSDATRKAPLYNIRLRRLSKSQQKLAKELAKERQEARQRFDEGAKLGIDTLVVVNPFYLQIDARKENSVEYVKSEKGEIRFLQHTKENAALTQAHITILDPLLMDTPNGQVLNDMAVLDEWAAEQLTAGGMLMPGTQQERVNEIAKRYGTKYFLWMGNVRLRLRFHPPFILYGLGILQFHLLPFALYKQMGPQYETLYYAIVFDVTTGKRSLIKYSQLRNPNTAMIHSLIYDTFLQITHE